MFGNRTGLTFFWEGFALTSMLLADQSVVALETKSMPRSVAVALHPELAPEPTSQNLAVALEPEPTTQNVAVALETEPESTTDVSAGQRRLLAKDEFSHFWDFRGCTTGEPVVDGIEGSSLSTTPMNGPVCGADGVNMDGNDDFVNIDDWEWGGTTSIEAYVKDYSFYKDSAILHFGGEQYDENVMLSNDQSSSTTFWWIGRGDTHKTARGTNFDSSTWTHVVLTVKDTTIKIYKNGVLVGTRPDGHEPSVLTRANNWLGRDAWSLDGTDGYMDGTISYIKIWHGVELQQSDATELYAPHNTAHHFWDFRGCTTGSPVTDSIAGDLVATPRNGTVCGADGIYMDGIDDYVNQLRRLGVGWPNFY
ncbi:hypothetical protein TL16_g01723 [Triparma laevis f. inornata]|uniref:LamG-like jellyroll fold domain-containing protein n=1 Tax=Triparma laevis f. inornata TaxID=1714386 RepID=A0A9W6ZPB7_9STRA|nr:hypothetical protein TL16_g01723 [Triparma laevis f. inornata]